MSKCYIPSWRRRRPSANSTERPVVRIRLEQYNEVADLAAETGRSITDIASLLLESALDDVEILYPGEEED